MDLEDEELLAERSPACCMENLATPTFIVHGKLDQYTPISSLRYMLQRAKKVIQKRAHQGNLPEDSEIHK